MYKIKLFDEFFPLFENSRKDAIQHFVNTGKISAQHFKDLQEMDPSRQGDKPGKMLYWIAKAVANTTPETPVTADDAIEIAEWIYQNEARLKNGGINTDIYSKNSPLYTYQGAAELQFSKGESKRKTKSDTKSGNVKGATILIDIPGYKLISVETHQAMIYWANYYEVEKLGSTKWCVAMEKTSNYWDNYTRYSKFFVLISENSKIGFKKIAIQKTNFKSTWWSQEDISFNHLIVEKMVNELPDELSSFLHSKKLSTKSSKAFMGSLNSLVSDGNIDNVISAIESMDMQAVLLSPKLKALIESGWFLKSTIIQVKNGNMSFWPKTIADNGEYPAAEVFLNYGKSKIEVKQFGKTIVKSYDVKSKDNQMLSLLDFYDVAFDIIKDNIDRTGDLFSREKIESDFENKRSTAEEAKQEFINIVKGNHSKLDVNISQDKQDRGYSFSYSEPTVIQLKRLAIWVTKKTKENKKVLFPSSLDSEKIAGKLQDPNETFYIIPLNLNIEIASAGGDRDEDGYSTRGKMLIKSKMVFPKRSPIVIRHCLIDQETIDRLEGDFLDIFFYDCLVEQSLSFKDINVSKIKFSSCDFAGSKEIMLDFGQNEVHGAIYFGKKQTAKICVSAGSDSVFNIEPGHGKEQKKYNIRSTGGFKMIGPAESIIIQESRIHTTRYMKYVQTFAAFEAALLQTSGTDETNESIASLVAELTNSDLNEAEVWDKIVAKLKGVGHDVARNVVMLALVASAFNGIPSAAAAAIHQASGVNVEQSQNPDITSSQAHEAMKKLEDRFYVGEGAEGETFLKFTGDIKDVVGIEPVNGYPIFRKGSTSAQAFHAAFDAQKIVKGTVDVHGKKVQGAFVVASGLYYPIINPVVAKEVIDVPVAAVAATAHEVTHGKMVDFSGILGQSAQMYKEMHGKLDGKELDRAAFTFAVIRKTFPSLAQVSDTAFETAFDVHGKFSPKIEVAKLGVNIGQDLQKLMGSH